MKRVLLDQGLAPATAGILRDSRWDAVHVSEAGLGRANDLEMLESARQQGRECVTLDHDFYLHLALTRSAMPTVVLLRVSGLGARQQAELIISVWNTCGEAIA
jgi:predicted nuclease of predicted toxin-antitoxin system